MKLVINNAVDIDTFNLENIKANSHQAIKNNGKKKVGYIGTISGWVQVDLIFQVAKERKDIDFYFIGPIEAGLNIDMEKRPDNVIFTGTQPYYEIPTILKQLDVTIMPFEKSKLIESVNPVKIYEYLSLGKPVIATRYEETEKFGDVIYTYGDKEEFMYQLEKSLQETGNMNDIRIKYARENSWESRVEHIRKMLKL